MRSVNSTAATRAMKYLNNQFENNNCCLCCCCCCCDDRTKMASHGHPQSCMGQCSYYSPFDRWACLCCAYPNGWKSLLSMQLFSLASAMLSLFAMINCRFVQIDSEIYQEQYEHDSIGSKENVHGVGFFAYADERLKCCETHDMESMQEHSEYLDFYENDFLTDEWISARKYAILAFILAFVLLVFSCALSCMAVIRRARMVLIILQAHVFVFQALLFQPVKGQLCEMYNCKLDHGAYMAFGALAATLISAVCTYNLRDFPGKLSYILNDIKNTTERHSQGSRSGEAEDVGVRSDSTSNNDTLVVDASLIRQTTVVQETPNIVSVAHRCHSHTAENQRPSLHHHPEQSNRMNSIDTMVDTLPTNISIEHVDMF